ncbi:MAG TPA: hypothetical protein VF636_11515 [Sphingomonas sp.]
MLTMVAGVAGAAGAEACSLTPRLKPRPHSDVACRKSLDDLIAVIRSAPSISDAELTRRTAELAISFDSSVSDPILDYPNRSPIELTELLRGWSASAGKADRKPIRLAEVNPLKENDGVALYQFTLLRDQYHPADEEGCNGLFTHEEFFGPERRSYLGTFINNRLRNVTAFDEWLAAL